MKIPRIVHQIWIQGEGAMPRRYRRWAESWRALHPDWEYVLWDDAALRRLLGEHLPELLALYERHQDFAERSDLGRYAVLHVHGGLYVDVDTRCVRPLDPLLQAGDARFLVALYKNLASKRPNDPFERIANSLIACVPRHPLWPGFFDLLCRTCAPGTFAPANTGPIKLWPYLRQWAQATSEEPGLIGPDQVLISFWMPLYWMRLRALLSPRLRVLDFNASGRRSLLRLGF
ncbi:MAG: glycosyltransferase [Thermoanaerobaculia bacterium]